MPRGNPSPKIAITVDPQVHDMATASADAEGVSLSAWITEAIRRRLQNEEGLRAVAEWELEHGAFTKEELSEAMREVTAEIVEESMRKSAHRIEELKRKTA